MDVNEIQDADVSKYVLKNDGEKQNPGSHGYDHSNKSLKNSNRNTLLCVAKINAMKNHDHIRTVIAAS